MGPLSAAPLSRMRGFNRLPHGSGAGCQSISSTAGIPRQRARGEPVATESSRCSRCRGSGFTFRVVQALAVRNALHTACTLVSATASDGTTQKQRRCEWAVVTGGSDSAAIVRTAGEHKCRHGGCSLKSVKEDDATQRTRLWVHCLIGWCPLARCAALHVAKQRAADSKFCSQSQAALTLPAPHSVHELYLPSPARPGAPLLTVNINKHARHNNHFWVHCILSPVLRNTSPSARR